MRWLSKGRSLARIFELKELFQIFLLEKQSLLVAYFSDREWVAKLAYLCDIVNLLIELQLSPQGRMTAVLGSADKVTGFKAKLGWWRWWMNIGILGRFQTLTEILKERTRAFFLLVGAWSPISAFKRVCDECYFLITKDPRTGKERIGDPSVNQLCLC